MKDKHEEVQLCVRQSRLVSLNHLQGDFFIFFIFFIAFGRCWLWTLNEPVAAGPVLCCNESRSSVGNLRGAVAAGVRQADSRCGWVGGGDMQQHGRSVTREKVQQV